MHFRLLYHYIGYFIKLYYKKIYINGKENIPGKDEAVIVVSNHQNAINDPLALEYAFPGRTINLFAHGNLFKKPLLNRFFRAIHVIPAYRMRTDGEESLSKNFTEFTHIGELLFKGEWAGIFPEATNMTGHWLGEFSLGYLRMAFSAAESAEFKKNIKILPVTIHYDNYHRFQKSISINILPSISLEPYYELYKTKPRTAQRQVNQLVRESIESNMLNVKDLDNYEAIDYIRERYGIKYCASKGLYYKILPDKLKTDIELVSKLEKESEKQREKIEKLYNKVIELKNATLKAGIRDWVLTNNMSTSWICIYCLTLLLLSPAFILGIIPNLLIYLAPIPLCKKFDKIGGPFVMFKGGVQILLSALITYPIALLVPIALLCCTAVDWHGYLFALAWFLLETWLIIFCWSYIDNVKKLFSLIRFRILKNSSEMTKILALRAKIWRELDEINI